MKLIFNLILILTVLAFNCLSQNNGQNDTMDNYEIPTISFGDEGENIDEDQINEYEFTDNEPTSIVDRWRHLYEQGKNITIRKNVEHINQTFETLKTFGENIKYLFNEPNDNREKQKAMEFLMEIDLGVTNDCYSAIIQLFKAINENKIWALKCK